MKQFFTELFNDIKVSVLSAGNRLIWAIVFLIAFSILIKITLNLTKKVLTRKNKTKIFKSFVVNLVRYSLISIMIMIMAEIIGIPNSTILAVASTATLAIGLTMQTVLTNITNGVILVNGKIFKEGDYVQIDSTSGTVYDIGLINSKLKTPDNKIISLPNSKIMNSVIVNYDSMENRRVDIEFRVSFDSDIEKVKELINEKVNSHSLILQNESKVIRFSGQNDNNLSVICKVWCKKEDYFTVLYDLTEQVIKSFKDNNIVMNNTVVLKNK